MGGPQGVGSVSAWCERSCYLTSHPSPQAVLATPGWLSSVSMVQKYQSPVRVYKYPFELVMAVSDP